MTAPSLLYLPNEGTPGDQVGPRAAFEALAREGRLSAYQAFSYLVEARRDGAEGALRRLEALVRERRPDVLLWQHVSDFPVGKEHLAALRAASPGTHLLYHEGDVYGRWVKRLPRATRRLMAAADTVALVGKGEYAALARGAGARRVIYTPHSADTVRFGRPWTPTDRRELDVVLIGNRLTSRRPWGRIPGAAAREALGRALGRRFGERFAVYGRGWEGFVGARGPLAFAEQEEAQRQAWVTVSWDHFDTVEAYFSDRLPIALLSGVPHVKNHQPGYEAVFGARPPFSWAKDVGGILGQVERLLALPVAERNGLGERARLWAAEHLTARPVYERLLGEALGMRAMEGGGHAG